MKKYQFPNLIWCKKHSLDKNFCKEIIHKFEQDSNKIKARTLGGYLPKIKQSTDLVISNFSSWETEDKIFSENLYENTLNYFSTYSEEFTFMNSISNFQDAGYQIQRTKPGEFYTWHHDFFNIDNSYRLLTLIWYLNDIEYDGQTEFIDGTKIKPEAGKLLIFPATWTYVHRGISPKCETKYICTTWVNIKTVKKDGKILYE